MFDSEDRLAYAPFEATTDPMTVVDTSSDGWTVLSINDAFEAVFGCRESGVRGESLAEVLGIEIRQRYESRIDADGEIETAVEPGTATGSDTSGERFRLRARTFDTSADASRLLVVLVPTDHAGGSAQFTTSPDLVEPFVSMVQADEPSAVCDAAAEVLCDQFGFDAFVADLETTTWLDGVRDPIPTDSPAEPPEAMVSYETVDQVNENVWGVLVRQPVGDRGYVQVAARNDTALEPADVHGIDLVCECIDAALERPERERRLRADREEAATLNQLLRHSASNGLNLIQARLDMVEGDVSEANRQHYETALARVDDMIERVEAVRQLRSDDGPQTEPRPLGPLVEARVDRARETYPSASFSVEVTGPDVRVAVDELAQFCLRNLFRNAVQHADAETPVVEVTVERTDDVAVVRVADNGPGLPDDLDGSVFGEGVSAGDGDGHGVGLYLTRKIVEDHYGGRVRAEETDGDGATFVLELPTAEPDERTGSQ
jgi:signal transduction histidine kinase